MLRQALRPSWFHLIFVAAAFLVLPVANVVTVQAPPQGCQQHEYVPPVFSVEPSPLPVDALVVWGPWISEHRLVGCDTSISTTRLAPIALLWARGDALAPPAPGDYSTGVSVQPTATLALAPVALYALASLVVAARELYGEDWRRAAQWLLRPGTNRTAFTVLGTLPLAGTFLPTILGMHNDDTFAALNIALAPFYLADAFLMDAFLGGMGMAAPSYALDPGAVYVGHYQSLNLDAASAATAIAAAALVAWTWFLASPFLAAMARTVRGQFPSVAPREPRSRFALRSLLGVFFSLLAGTIFVPLRFDLWATEGLLDASLWQKLAALILCLAVTAFALAWSRARPAAWWALCAALPLAALLALQGVLYPEAWALAVIWAAACAAAAYLGAWSGTRLRGGNIRV